ncbi:MAG: aldehyde dehydrogenase family protein [Proteobacteria bacterium]|nr:aldehyde dehydrogenase family protein [Pseudomonadota bacterium]
MTVTPEATQIHEYTLYIDGRFRSARGGGVIDVRNPATGALVGRVASAGAPDVEDAIAAARHAFDDGRWSGLSPGERSAALFKLAQVLENRADLLARLETLQTGKPIKLSKNGDIPFAIDNLRFFAGAARVLEGRAAAEYVTGYTSMIRREPIGVIASIAPWNYPFMMAIWKIGPALAAGNTVVLKPASITPLTAFELADAAREAGIPDGVLNVVSGPGDEVGPMLCTDRRIDMVSLTGDTSTGRTIMEAASKTLKRVHLELGGKAALVVFEDADLEAAAQGAAVAGFMNTGQDCTAATRVYVHESVKQAFIDKLVARTRKVRVGDPLDEKTDLGPLMSAAQLDKVVGFVDRAAKAGARVAVGGQRLTDGALGAGFYFAPTVVTDVAQDAELMQCEAFGPVLAVGSFSTVDEAVSKANDVEFGLASSVWTRDVFKAFNVSRRLDFGTVWINDHLPIASEMPHGGFKQSGFGKDMSMYAFEEYTRVKHVMAELGGDAVKGWHGAVFGDEA